MIALTWFLPRVDMVPGYSIPTVPPGPERLPGRPSPVPDPPLEPPMPEPEPAPVPEPPVRPQPDPPIIDRITWEVAWRPALIALMASAEVDRSRKRGHPAGSAGSDSVGAMKGRKIR